MGDEKIKGAPGLFDLLTSFKLSSIFGKKEKEEEAGYPLADAKRDWARANELVQSGQYDQATPLFRKAVESLLKANCPRYWSKASAINDLPVLAKKVLGELPAEISEALTFLNPHCTLVKSVYKNDFICEVRDKSRLVIKWIMEHRPSYSTFDPDTVPPSKYRR